MNAKRYVSVLGVAGVLGLSACGGGGGGGGGDSFGLDGSAVSGTTSWDSVPKTYSFGITAGKAYSVIVESTLNDADLMVVDTAPTSSSTSTISLGLFGMSSKSAEDTVYDVSVLFPKPMAPHILGCTRGTTRHPINSAQPATT